MGPSIAWSAPAGCPSQAALQRRASELTRGSAGSVRAASAVVTRTPEGFHAELTVTTARGEGSRALDAPTCEVLAEQVAVVVAMSAVSSPPAPALTAPTGPPTAPSSAPAPTLRGTPAEPPRAEPPRRGPVAPPPPPSKVAWDVGAHPAWGAGTLPSLALGAGLSVALTAGHVRVEGALTAWLPQVATFPGRVAGGEFDLASGALRGCAVTGGRLTWGGCVGVSVDRLAGVGVGVVQASSEVAWAWAPSAGLFARIRLGGPFALRLSVDGLLPVSRRAFVVEPYGALHRPAPVFGRLIVGPEVRF